MIESFLLRVYRFNQQGPQELAGTIQVTSKDICETFASFEEFCAILQTHLTAVSQEQLDVTSSFDRNLTSKSGNR